MAMSSGGPADGHGENHGNSVAAWTAVVVITLGFVVGGLAFAFSWVWMFWTGVGLCVVGVAAGKVLAMMGFGVSQVGTATTSAAAANDG
jgi:hypothetical protein